MVSTSGAGVGSSMSSEEQCLNDEVAQDEEEGKEGECFNCMLAATEPRSGDRISASMVAPILSGKDERREPEIAEDEMQRRHYTAILGYAWQNRSNKVHNHCYDSNDFHVHNINAPVRKPLQPVAHYTNDNNGGNPCHDIAEHRGRS